MVEKIYIARHGQDNVSALQLTTDIGRCPGFRLNWVTNNWQSKTGLPRDPPLTAFGEAQAKELRDYFLSLPKHERPTAIFSSPYYRCLQTSQPTSIALGIPIFVEHGIAEWYSPVVPGTGLHPRPGSASTLQQYFSQIDTSWSSVWYPSRKGEDVQEVHERTDGFLKAFLPEIRSKLPGEHSCILLVSHAATIIALARGLVGNREMTFKVGCCSLSEFTRIPQSQDTPGGWKPQRLADGAHLKEGSLREWGFEDIEIAAGKVVEDPGVPGTELDTGLDEPLGLQVQISSNL